MIGWSWKGYLCHWNKFEASAFTSGFAALDSTLRLVIFGALQHGRRLTVLSDNHYDGEIIHDLFHYPWTWIPKAKRVSNMATMNSSSSNAAMLKHYRMNDLFPNTWDDQHGTERPGSASGLRRNHAIRNNSPKRNSSPRRISSSRFSILQEEGGYRSTRISGFGLGGISESNLPQDEPDPLGKSSSVVNVLRANGVSDVDLNLRFSKR